MGSRAATFCPMTVRDSDDGHFKMSRAEFTSWLRQRLVSRAPTAVVRFGDGEVRLFKADADDPGSIEVANGQLEKQTGRSYPPEAVVALRDLLEDAYNRADVLGIPDGVRFSGPRSTNPLAVLYSKRIAAGNPPVALADSILHHELLGELPEFLAERPVSAITCRDVKPVIEEEWGVEDVAVYQVPSQYSVRGLDGAYETAMHDARIWPDVYDRVVSNLTVREPGEVFLVGAGVFGKSLCIRVREQGGIGLDLGSALDHIVGKLSRLPLRMALDLHASGMSIAEIADDLKDRFGAEIDRDRIRYIIDAVTPYTR
jgi:hypothetical protein